MYRDTLDGRPPSLRSISQRPWFQSLSARLLVRAKKSAARVRRERRLKTLEALPDAILTDVGLCRADLRNARSGNSGRGE